MKDGWLTLLALAAGLAASAQVAPVGGSPAATFIPEGYYELPDGRAAGDLNADGRPDLALVLAPLAEDTVAKDSGENDLPPRLLLVLFAQPNGRYRLAAQSRQAVLCKGCGGQYDPFSQLEITKGCVVLSQQGGNSGRWGIINKFRYQQGDFFLIGETYWTSEVGPECPPGTSEDTNLLTGAYEITTTTAASCTEHKRRGHRKVLPLRRMAD